MKRRTLSKEDKVLEKLTSDIKEKDILMKIWYLIRNSRYRKTFESLLSQSSKLIRLNDIKTGLNEVKMLLSPSLYNCADFIVENLDSISFQDKDDYMAFIKETICVPDLVAYSNDRDTTYIKSFKDPYFDYEENIYKNILDFDIHPNKCFYELRLFCYLPVDEKSPLNNINLIFIFDYECNLTMFGLTSYVQINGHDYKDLYLLLPYYESYELPDNVVVNPVVDYIYKYSDLTYKFSNFRATYFNETFEENVNNEDNIGFFPLYVMNDEKELRFFVTREDNKIKLYDNPETVDKIITDTKNYFDKKKRDRLNNDIDLTFLICRVIKCNECNKYSIIVLNTEYKTLLWECQHCSSRNYLSDENKEKYDKLDDGYLPRSKYMRSVFYNKDISFNQFRRDNIVKGLDTLSALEDKAQFIQDFIDSEYYTNNNDRTILMHLMNFSELLSKAVFTNSNTYGYKAIMSYSEFKVSEREPYAFKFRCVDINDDEIDHMGVMEIFKYYNEHYKCFALYLPIPKNTVPELNLDDYKVK